MARNFVGIDLGAAMQVASQIRANRARTRGIELANERMLDQNQKLTLLPEAREAAMKGDFELLDSLNPQESQQIKMGIEQQQALQFKTQQAMQGRQREKIVDGARIQNNLLRAFKDNPTAENWFGIRNKAGQMIQQGILPQEAAQKFPEIMIDPDVTGLMIQDTQRDLDLLDPQGSTPVKMSNEARTVLERMGQPGNTQLIGSPEYMATLNRMGQASERLRRAGAVQVSVGTGQQELEKAAKTSVQKEQIADLGVLSDIEAIREGTKPEFLTFGGAARSRILPLAEKFGVDIGEEKQFVSDYEGWKNNVKTLFNKYRKQITGAAASEKELKDLGDAMINTRQSESQFESSLENMRVKVSRMVRLRNRLLREGLTVGTEEFGNRLDDLYFDNKDANTTQDRTARAKELLGTGLSQQEVKQRLLQEGY